MCNQSLQQVLIRAKKILLKNSKWLSKNAEFHADFESVEKVLKNAPKKFICKNVTEICPFSLLLMFIKLVLLITSFWCIYSQLFQRIQNQREILRFLISFLIFFKNKFFEVILALF
jgi:hypothetical protein